MIDVPTYSERSEDRHAPLAVTASRTVAPTFAAKVASLDAIRPRAASNRKVGRAARSVSSPVVSPTRR